MVCSTSGPRTGGPPLIPHTCQFGRRVSERVNRADTLATPRAVRVRGLQIEKTWLNAPPYNCASKFIRGAMGARAAARGAASKMATTSMRIHVQPQFPASDNFNPQIRIAAQCGKPCARCRPDLCKSVRRNHLRWLSVPASTSAPVNPPPNYK